MTERAVDCGACGAPVPLGRLSCPACGELLASVSGGFRASVWSSGRPQPSVLHDVIDDAADADADDGLMALAVDLPVNSPPTLFDLEPEPEPGPVEPEPEPEHGHEPDPEPAWPTSAPEPAWPPPASTWVAPAFAAAPSAPVAPLPGAYVPPTVSYGPGSYGSGPRPSVMAAAAPLAVAMPGGRAAPARAWAPASAATAAAVVAAEETPADAAASAARMAEGIGWVAIAGGVLAMLGFVAPWARTMIGSGGDRYIDNWGLAGPGHLFVGIALGVIVALTVVPNRIPAWLRLGIPGLDARQPARRALVAVCVRPTRCAGRDLCGRCSARSCSSSPGSPALVADRHAAAPSGV